MSDNSTNQNTEQQTAATPTPEAAGDQGEKRFTQADLDRMIGERLRRERAKAEPSPLDERETQLKARESRLDCRDFLEGLTREGKAASGVLGLLDVLDTADSGKFQETVAALLTLGAFNPQLEPLKIPPVERRGDGPDPIAAAFRPKFLKG